MALAKVFCDGMVLQRDREIIVYGVAAGTVTVEFLGQTRSVNTPGPFEMRFPALAAGGPYEMTVTEDGKTRVIRDILVGDVYVISGQSNPELKLNQTAWTPQACEADGLARVFHCRKLLTPDAFDDSWHAKTLENSGNWSAIAYHLSGMLRAEKNIPIGMVCCYQGACIIQSFLSPRSAMQYMYPEDQMHRDMTHETYHHFNHDSLMYHLGVQHLFPLGVKGVVWYQGESNSSVQEGKHYHEMLEDLIREWREGFREEKLPFVVVQINDYLNASDQAGWKLIQQAQEKAVAETPYTRLVRIADMGQHDLIHPTNKREVTERIYAAFSSLEKEAK